MKYRHCVYGAGLFPENEASIARAKRKVEWLTDKWDVEHDVVLCAYHSKFDVHESGNNIEICLENDDLRQLINDCMEWAVLGDTEAARY